MNVSLSHGAADPAAPFPLSARSSTPRFGLLMALLAALLLVLAALRPLSVPDEGRYGDISRWMLVSGDWLIPRMDGLPLFHKPPLSHWLQAASMAVFGITPWAARLPGVLLAMLMVAGLYVAVRRLLDEAVARRAALMLGTSVAVLLGGQYVNHDMGVAAWIATTIWCFALSLLHGERPHAGWARAGFAVSALGVLTKGLIGMALPGLVLFVWISWTRQWRKVPRLPWLSGLALFALIAVPWFVLAARQYPGLWDYLFGVQQFARYTGGGFNNQQPWWFYLVAVLLLLFPWGFFAVYEGFAGARRAQPATEKRANEVVSLAWIWLAAIVLFFSIPRSKLIGYILPVMPPLALLAALGWQRAMAGRRHAGRWFAALAALPLAAAVVVTLVFTHEAQDKLAHDVARELACRAAPGDTVYAAGGFPYDLPFAAGLRQPMVVVADWPRLRAETGDSWERELFEAADFQPALGDRLLRTPDVLDAAAHQPGQWLVVKRGTAASAGVPEGWKLAFEGTGWRLYRSDAAEGSSAAAGRTCPG